MGRSVLGWRTKASKDALARRSSPREHRVAVTGARRAALGLEDGRLDRLVGACVVAVLEGGAAVRFRATRGERERQRTVKASRAELGFGISLIVRLGLVWSWNTKGQLTLSQLTERDDWRKPCASWEEAAMSLETLFKFANYSVIPFWLLLIFAPGWSWTRPIGRTARCCSCF